VEPPGRIGVPADDRPARGVLQPPAVLRPGAPRGLGQVAAPDRPAAGAPRDPALLRVVTWNIRAAIGPGEPFPPAWWRHVRRDRLERIAAILADLEPDVITLQEVSILTPDGDVLDQPAELARRLGREVRYAATHVFPLVEPETGRAIGMAGWGNAILTRTPLAGGFAVGLPRATDDDVVEPAGADHPLAGVRYGDAEPGHREPRTLVGGTLDGIAVATAHLTYIGREQRGRQADAVRLALDALAGPAILTGDFNAPLSAAELAPFRDGLVDTFAAVGLAADDPRRASCGPWPIDHVLVRGLEVASCRVVTEAGAASAHWPVLAELRRT
jgi:endonuclease/exonuclease/phosphatase family metal-dependent hydrolase